ncbi:MAG: HWE histidine kinase domain-containing protein [Hyphomicrobium sp.]
MSLVALILAPLVGLFAWLALTYAGAQRQVIEVQRFDAVNTLTSVLDRDIASILGALKGLSTSEDLANQNFEEFRRRAEPLAAQMGFLSISVIEPAGKTIFSTWAEDGNAPQPALAADYLQRVFKGESVVSDVSQSAPSGRPSVMLAVPVKAQSDTNFALVARVDPLRFDSIFKETTLANGWVVAVVDRNGRFVARSLSSTERVGLMARPELGEAARGEPKTGEFTNITHEGVAVMNSFRRSQLSEWTTVVAVPQDLLAAPLYRTITLLAVGGLVGAMAVLSLAFVMASRISEPVRSLSSAAEALVEGRQLPETPQRIAELEEVRAAFEFAVSKSAHLAAIVASSGHAIMSVDANGVVRSWNKGAERLFGYSADDIIGRPKALVVPASKAEEFAHDMAAVLSGQSMRVETLRKTRDGKEIDVSLDLSPIYGPTGKIVAISSIAHDITERIATDEHQRFLMRELTHRSKNLLAIVQSMASQTARTSESLVDFREKFSQRLRGLAASHDLLVAQGWRGAPLEDLIRGQLAVFVENGASHLKIDGAAVNVGPRAAQAIGLALHELATNSIKYGALSTPNGHVAISWTSMAAPEGAEQMQLTWQEHGGPPVSPPVRKGFGHFVIERMISQSVDGAVDMQFPVEGLIWRLTFPMSNLADAPGSLNRESEDRPQWAT